MRVSGPGERLHRHAALGQLLPYLGLLTDYVISILRASLSWASSFQILDLTVLDHCPLLLGLANSSDGKVLTFQLLGPEFRESLDPLFLVQPGPEAKLAVQESWHIEITSVSTCTHTHVHTHLSAYS